MNNKFLSVVLGFIFAFSAFGNIASADDGISPGLLYETTQHVNLRSGPWFGDNRIDYLQKGMTVMVDKVNGSWCKVKHYKYLNVYLACQFLKRSNDTLIPLTIVNGPADSVLLLGEKLALYNINVRSKPYMGKNLIGNIKKGSTVVVTSTEGEWCKINYKNYQNAYVYCKLLAFDAMPLILSVIDKAKIQTISNESSTKKYSVANEEISKLYDWTMDNNEAGRTYINHSASVGGDLAKKWQEDAKQSGLKFNWPAKKGGSYCEIYFASESEPSKTFVYNCAETGKTGASKVVNKSSLTMIDTLISSDFKVPFARLLAKFQDYNQNAWKSVNDYFRNSKEASFEFTLYNDSQGDHWNVVIRDEKGNMLRFLADADTEDFKAPMMMFSGN